VAALDLLFGADQHVHPVRARDRHGQGVEQPGAEELHQLRRRQITVQQHRQQRSPQAGHVVEPGGQASGAVAPGESVLVDDQQTGTGQVGGDRVVEPGERRGRLQMDDAVEARGRIAGRPTRGAEPDGIGGPGFRQMEKRAFAHRGAAVRLGWCVPSRLQL